MENLKALRNLYGVSIDYLLFDEESEVLPAPEMQPELVAVDSSHALICSRRLRWVVITVVIAALAVIAAIILPKQTLGDSNPFSSFDGSAVIVGEDGKPIEGIKLDELFDDGNFTCQSVESARERN